MDNNLEIDIQISRTINIIKELSKGKILKLNNNLDIGMSEDLIIGYISYNSNEHTKGISKLSEINFRELNDILNKNNTISFIN